MITAIATYLFIGVLYSALLERFTTNNLEGPLGDPWTSNERVYHIVMWPLSMSVFVYNFIKEFFKNL
jgi:hypothetical protein